MFRLIEKIRKEQAYIIAEMSANHGGKLKNALEIVRQAARAGADCVKIQTAFGFRSGFPITAWGVWRPWWA